MLNKATIQSDQKTLFDFIAKTIAEFMRKNNIRRKIPLGFTFSFRVHQTSLTAGTLIKWTKDFTAKDCVGEDVVRMLREAIDRKEWVCHFAGFLQTAA